MNAKGTPPAGRGLPALLFVILACSLPLSGCGEAQGAANAVSTTKLTSGAVAASATAVPCPPTPEHPSALALVYAEPSSRTLVTALVTMEAGGTATTEATVLDRIAEGPDTSPGFGAHTYARIGDAEYLAYLDRAADGRLALKYLRRPAGSATWEVDLLTPAGVPLCFLSRGRDVRLLTLDGTDLLEHTLSPSRPQPATLLKDCRPEGQVSVVRAPSGDSFALYDAARGAILIGTLSGDSVSVSPVSPPPGLRFGSPNHLRLGSDDRRSLFFYDPDAEDLVDLVDVGKGNEVHRVTRARGVTAVYASSQTGHTIYVYAETTRTSAGRPTYALSMVQSRTHGRGGEAAYRRIHTSSTPYAAVQPLVADGELRVVMLTDTLQLLRVPLASP